ncbi:MAG: hypothetical protein R3272_01410 [Candidatus Promineifilaceae bacterium]|nr:hypothetical protein [Candidatus Promineifilaceae bacterium]
MKTTLRQLRRTALVYGAYAGMVPKLFLAYSSWVWMNFIVQGVGLVIFVAFWRAIYAEQDLIGGLDLQQTLNYIILAQIFLPAVHSAGTIYYFGELLREGRVGIELLRPLDFQGANYAANLADMALGLVVQLPLAAVAWIFFRFTLPSDPLIWIAFAITLLMGNTALFFFDWILACISFYSTETWGLTVLRFGAAQFFSGALIPLVMMPEWLARLAGALPFAQALYMPVSLLSGVTPLSEAPTIWMMQLLYILGLGLLSRLVFRVSVRRVTVQGG